MKILISPVSLQEAKIAWECGTDIIDIKNINEGSLGASFPWIISEVIKTIADPKVVFSATLGDLPYKPGTAALAALGVVSLGISYVKAGLHGPKTLREGLDVMNAVVRAVKDYNPNALVVTAGYADYKAFSGLDPDSIVHIGATSGSDIVMLDTFYKNGKNLFDALTVSELISFVSKAHQAGLKVALAGSVRAEHISVLREINVDIVGVRGAVCNSHERSSTIDPEKARNFIQSINQPAVAV
jgi:(5-formylfuran-3-yl)methyl phosphate synthase